MFNNEKNNNKFCRKIYKKRCINKKKFIIFQQTKKKTIYNIKISIKYFVTTTIV